MNPGAIHRGPWQHRFLIWFFSALLGVLVFWLLGFVVNDIGTWPGPDPREIEARLIGGPLLEDAAANRRDLEETARLLTDEKARQAVLRDSTENSARTMNQLLEIQRLNAQRGVTASDSEQAALRDAQQIFLRAQGEYQSSNDRTSELTERARQLEVRRRDLDLALEAARRPVREEYGRLHTRHQLTLAALKLSVLVPVLVLAVWLLLRWRGGPRAPAAYALGLATLVKVLMVMHQHFPRFYFKYILIGAALIVVARSLACLLRSAMSPRREWVLRQYREAYEHHLCPVCSHPIRRGPLRFAYWTRRSVKRLVLQEPGGAGDDTPYVCPVCGNRLFEPCPSCGGIRHSLLPACVHCGAEKRLPGAEGAGER